MKKGFFFSLDAFFAIMTFTLVLVSIYGYFVNTQELRQQYYYSEDVLNVFTKTKMGELIFNNINFEILKDGGFINPELSIMDQIIFLNNEGYPDYSQWIYNNLTSDFFGERYGTSFDIGMNNIFESQKNATALVSRRRFVSG